MAVGVKKGNVVKFSISVSQSSADWVDRKLKDYKYRNISHVFESLIKEKITAEQNP